MYRIHQYLETLSACLHWFVRLYVSYMYIRQPQTMGLQVHIASWPEKLTRSWRQGFEILYWRSNKAIYYATFQLYRISFSTCCLVHVLSWCELQLFWILTGKCKVTANKNRLTNKGFRVGVDRPVGSNLHLFIISDYQSILEFCL